MLKWKRVQFFDSQFTYPIRLQTLAKPHLAFISSLRYLCAKITDLSQRPLSRQCEIPWQFHNISLPMLSVTHIMLALVLLSVVGEGMQQCMIQKQTETLKFSKVKNGCKYAANNKQI